MDMDELYIVEIEDEGGVNFYATAAKNSKDATYNAVTNYKMFFHGEDILSVVAYPAKTTAKLMAKNKR